MLTFTTSPPGPLLQVIGVVSQLWSQSHVVSPLSWPPFTFQRRLTWLQWLRGPIRECCLCSSSLILISAATGMVGALAQCQSNSHPPPRHPATPLGPDHHKPRRTSPPSHYKSAGRGLKVGESVSEARVRHLLRCDPIFDVTECILFIFFARLCRSQLCRSMTNKKRHGKQNSNSSESDGGEREGGGTTQYKWFLLRL